MDAKETSESEANDDKKSKPAIILRFKRTRFLKQFGCTACLCSYKQLMNLKCHIRRKHFNMEAETTNRDHRQINDVWLERVLNSDDIIEIKKAGPNKYLMKKASTSDGVDVLESTEDTDMTPMYPDRPLVSCCVCSSSILVTDYKDHLEYQHPHMIGAAQDQTLAETCGI